MSSNTNSNTTMIAGRIHSHGPADVLVIDSNVPIPTPSATQVLIKVYYSGVNYIDTYQRTGLYKIPLPSVLGREGAGIITAVGDEAAKLFSIGDRVCFFSQGSYGQFTAVETAAVAKLPDALGFDVGAAAFLQGLTAHYLTTGSYKIQSGDTVLIHAAAGGTGALLTQIAKFKGAIVIATVGSQEKVEIARSAGADHIIQYREQDFQSEVMKLTGNKGVQAVYDGVGLTTWNGSLKSLARLGTLVLFGNASGPVPPINPLDLMNQGSISMIRPSLAHYIASRSEFDSRANELFQWISSGALKLNIAKEFPLSELIESHKSLESRQFAGKLLIKIPQND